MFVTKSGWVTRQCGGCGDVMVVAAACVVWVNKLVEYTKQKEKKSTCPRRVASRALLLILEYFSQ